MVPSCLSTCSKHAGGNWAKEDIERLAMRSSSDNISQGGNLSSFVEETDLMSSTAADVSNVIL